MDTKVTQVRLVYLYVTNIGNSVKKPKISLKMKSVLMRIFL